MAFDPEAFLRWPSLQAPPACPPGALPGPLPEASACPVPAPQACNEWQDLDSRGLPCRPGDLIRLRHCRRHLGQCEGVAR